MRIDNVTARDLIDRDGYVRKGYKENTTIKALCEDLLEARNQDSIWKDAPEDARYASVYFGKELGYFHSKDNVLYERELPKSKEEVLVEKLIEAYDTVMKKDGYVLAADRKGIFMKVLKENDPS